MIVALILADNESRHRYPIHLIVHLEDNILSIQRRFEARGKVPLMEITDKTFEKLFKERKPVYEKYADCTITRDIPRADDADIVISEIITYHNAFSPVNASIRSGRIL
ncbi:MAG: shikimate kinase [Planctomycetota bacterium]